MKKTFYELAVANPGVVSWYCALKLEMAVHLTKNLLTQQMHSEDVPGLEAAKQRLLSSLRERLGHDVDLDSLPDLKFMGQVDDFYASFEWSNGGMIHAHMAFWIVGSPRIDKVVVPKDHGEHVEITATCDTDVVMPQTDAANVMACFWDRVISEFNVAKALHQFTEALPGEANVESSFGVASATGLR